MPDGCFDKVKFDLQIHLTHELKRYATGSRITRLINCLPGELYRFSWDKRVSPRYTTISPFQDSVGQRCNILHKANMHYNDYAHTSDPTPIEKS